MELALRLEGADFLNSEKGVYGHPSEVGPEIREECPECSTLRVVLLGGYLLVLSDCGGCRVSSDLHLLNLVYPVTSYAWPLLQYTQKECAIGTVKDDV